MTNSKFRPSSIVHRLSSLVRKGDTMKTLYLDHFLIKLNGNYLDKTHIDKLLSVEVDNSLFLPDMFAIHMDDPEVKDLEADYYKPGSTIEISVQLRAPSDKESPPQPVILMN